MKFNRIMTNNKLNLKSKLIFITLFITLAMLTSCSNKIIGTWIIQRYDIAKPEQKSVSFYNIGIMRFEEDGTGSNNTIYDIAGVKIIDRLPFKWKSTKNNITIISKGSEFSRTWILLENKRRSQKWESTNDSNQVQTLILTKRGMTSFTINTVN
ncbi:MAG: hypothetical protein WCL51_13205 [Bacteroidota bacterium]